MCSEAAKYGSRKNNLYTFIVFLMGHMFLKIRIQLKKMRILYFCIIKKHASNKGTYVCAAMNGYIAFCLKHTKYIIFYDEKDVR